MGRETDEAKIHAAQERGDHAGAIALAQQGVQQDRNSTHRRWTLALVLARAGQPAAGLDIAVQLRDTEAWQHVFIQTSNIAMWAGRHDLGLWVLDDWLSSIEQRRDVHQAGIDYVEGVVSYLAHSWVGGQLDAATERIRAHREFDDSGWSMGHGTIVVGPANQIVDVALEPTLAARAGRRQRWERFNDDYEALLDTLFGLDALDPNTAWNEINALEAAQPLRPLADPYRARTMRRFGDDAAAWTWVQRWIADWLFPMSVHDLVVTGLLGFFCEIRPQWAAAQPG